MRQPDLPDSSGPASMPAEAILQGSDPGPPEAAAQPAVSRSDPAPPEGDLNDRQALEAAGGGRRLLPGRSRRRNDDPARTENPSPAEALTLAEADDTQTDAEAKDRPPRQLHPLPPGLVELYGLLAVLFVLVPEWMAGGALFGFREGRRGSELPAPSSAWKRLPELRLASLNLAELRQLSRERGLIGYSRQSRQELSGRLLKRLKARP